MNVQVVNAALKNIGMARNPELQTRVGELTSPLLSRSDLPVSKEACSLVDE